MSSSALSETGLEALGLEAGLPVPIDIRPMKSARRFRLRFDDVSGRLKLTCPARTSRRSALAWAADQRPWIDAQLARAEPPEPFEPGATIPVEGREVRLSWSPDAPRTPRLEGDILHCGGSGRRAGEAYRALSQTDRSQDDVRRGGAFRQRGRSDRGRRQHRRSGYSLGQLLVGAAHPAKLAADSRAAQRAAVRRRA